MKKLLIVLLALTVLGVFAFADDAMAAAPAPAPIGTFTAWNNGIAVLYQSINGGTGQTTWEPAWDSVTGIDQEWEFGYHGKNYGFYADLEFGMDNFGNSGDLIAAMTSKTPPTTWQGATISRFATYYDVAPSLVRVEIGKPRAGRAPGGFAEGGSMGQFYLNSQFGADIQLLPVSGFSATVFTLIPEATADTNYSKSLTFVADYNMPNVFDVNAMYSTINDEFTGGVTVTAVKPASIVVAWDLNTLNGTVANVWASVGGTFVPNLYTALDLEYMSNASSTLASSVNSFGSEAKVEYTLTPMYAVGVRFGYADGKANGSNLWGTNLGDILNEGGVLVYPYVKANFDNGSFVSLGVAYESGAGAGVSAIQIPLAYVWSF